MNFTTPGLVYSIIHLLKIVYLDAEGGDISELQADLGLAEMKVKEWKSHLLRSVNQDKGRFHSLEMLGTNEALLIMDWAMKFLPLSFR